MAFEVLVDDNFHAYDESERHSRGLYDTLEEAIAVCQAIVDRDLANQYEPGMTADQLYQRYTSFGDDPWIKDTEHPGGTSPRVPFSAWSYAQQRSAEMSTGESTSGEASHDR